jgi:hypothetical protein
MKRHHHHHLDFFLVESAPHAHSFMPLNQPVRGFIWVTDSCSRVIQVIQVTTSGLLLGDEPSIAQNSRGSGAGNEEIKEKMIRRIRIEENKKKQAI